jgi:Xaa-Pro aminopeptidase
VDAAKHERLARFARERGVEAVWIRRRANIAWLTDGADVHCDLGSELGVASVLWTARGATVLTNTIEAARLRDEEPFQGFSFDVADWFHAAKTPELEHVSDWPDDALIELRAPLTDLELARVRALGRETGTCLEATLRDVRRGASELDVAAALGAALRRRGIRAPVLLVAADGRIARYRHPIPTQVRLERVLMAAVCAERHGLIVSATRLVHFGALDADLRRRHDAVCAVDVALHGATVPGARYGDVLRRGIDAYAASGFADEWTKHHQGGPMGYALRDFCATPGEPRAVVERQIVGWNPSITGTKSEDSILSGGEVLTRGDGSWPVRGDRPDILVR